MRDIISHIDGYALDSKARKHVEIEREQLQVGSRDGKAFRWLKLELNVDKLFTAGQSLYLSIHDAEILES